MLIPHARARRVIAALVAAATLAGCGASPSGGPKRADTDGQAASANALPASPAGAASPSTSDSAKPSSSASAKPSPSKTQTTAAVPPAGAGYGDRLPKFDRAPEAVKVQLPGGASAAYFSRIPTDQPVAFITID